ncbi:hypothetical protein GJ496_009989 [Pomphorhynchus laevis]|nr:hypothetical protein GJ496_009989 [Pomphorhynchus laevis]
MCISGIPCQAKNIYQIDDISENNAQVHNFNLYQYPIAELLNTKLWKKFDAHGTEMIINKQGRRMFPYLLIKLIHLNPDKQYEVSVRILPVDNNTWRFKNGIWRINRQSYDRVLGPIIAKDKRRFMQQQNCNIEYIHPDSPAKGLHWMNNEIAFDKLKITNDLNSSNPYHIVLNSMRKYMPRIIVKEIKEYQVPTDATEDVLLMVEFPETSFIAVTLYQNYEITNLKIHNNPFAKAFRYNTSSEFNRCIYSNPQYADRNEFNNSIKLENLHFIPSSSDQLQQITRNNFTNKYTEDMVDSPIPHNSACIPSILNSTNENSINMFNDCCSANDTRSTRWTTQCLINRDSYLPLCCSTTAHTRQSYLPPAGNIQYYHHHQLPLYNILQEESRFSPQCLASMSPASNAYTYEKLKVLLNNYENNKRLPLTSLYVNEKCGDFTRQPAMIPHPCCINDSDLDNNYNRCSTNDGHVTTDKLNSEDDSCYSDNVVLNLSNRSSQRGASTLNDYCSQSIVNENTKNVNDQSKYITTLAMSTSNEVNTEHTPYQES